MSAGWSKRAAQTYTAQATYVHKSSLSSEGKLLFAQEHKFNRLCTDTQNVCLGALPGFKKGLFEVLLGWETRDEEQESPRHAQVLKLKSLYYDGFVT